MSAHSILVGTVKYYKEVTAHLHIELEKAIGNAVGEIMCWAADIETVSFTAFTDYYNDGEECNYHVHIDTMEINGEYGWEYAKENECEDIYDSIQDIFTYHIDPELFKLIFGDGVKIIIKRDGSIEVKEYTDHD